MATYPALPLHADSREEPIDERIGERASDGTYRARLLQTAVKRRFRAVHILRDADKQTLEAFYVAQRSAADISFTWSPDGTTYTCAFGEPPRFQPLANKSWRCEMTLEQI
jgi:hypothetical protein